MPETKGELIETFGEVAKILGCGERWARELWKLVGGFKLKHRLGARGRIKMTVDEMRRFKKLVQARQRVPNRAA